MMSFPSAPDGRQPTQHQAVGQGCAGQVLSAGACDCGDACGLRHAAQLAVLEGDDKEARLGQPRVRRPSVTPCHAMRHSRLIATNASASPYSC